MVVDVSSIPFQEFWHMQIHQQHLQVRTCMMCAKF